SVRWALGAPLRREGWAGSWTVFTADSLPLAVTWAAMLPLVTGTVENVIGSSPFAHGFLTTRNAAAPAASANTMILGSQRFSFTVGKVIPRYEPKVARLLRYVALKIPFHRTGVGVAGRKAGYING